MITLPLTHIIIVGHFIREQKFRSCRIRRRKSLHFDSSSEELSNIFGDSDNGTVADRVNVKHLNDVEDISLLEPPPDYEVISFFLSFLLSRCVTTKEPKNKILSNIKIKSQ